MAQERERAVHLAVLRRRSLAVSPLPIVRTLEGRAALYSLIRLAVMSARGVSVPK